MAGQPVVRETDRQVLRELRKWLRCGDPWVRRVVLRELTGIPDRDLLPALARLRLDGYIEHEHRVGALGGVYRAVTPFPARPARPARK